VARVNFYLLRHDDAHACLLLACRLCEQLVRQGRAVRVLAENEAQARAFDQLLWNFSAESFVPHALRDAAPTGYPPTDCSPTDCSPTDCPALIDWRPEAFTDGNLLNLTTALPPHHGTLDSIAEFVLNTDAAKTLNRHKWNTYKQYGYEVQRHQI
jgi:DNA polymerase-3 subunit chi